jgi:S1-C subfamily serine protease
MTQAEFERIWKARVEDDAVWAPESVADTQHYSPAGPPPPEEPPTAAMPMFGDAAPSPSRPSRVRRTVAIGLALALLSGVAGAGIAAARRDDTPAQAAVAAQPIPTVTIPAAPSTPAVTPSDGTDSANGSQTAAPEARRGVVEITTTIAFGRGRGAGTGMLITPDGEVLTNNHVIDGATDISVQVNGTGRAYKATVVGTDATHDIALLRLAGASGLATIQSANSSTLGVGDAVTAIGNAQGQPGPPTVATGTVTALNQSITAGERGGDGEDLAGLIQTDVPLQPGDSGGPLLNSKSQVVGINTAASSARASARTGVQEGFAIPIEQALAIAKDIEAGRSSATIQIGPPAFLGIGLATAPTGGAAVLDVQDGTPAANAGLVAGDTITTFDGKPVADATALRALIDAHKPGDKVSMAWLDSSGQRHTATVTLASGPPK